MKYLLLSCIPDKGLVGESERFIVLVDKPIDEVEDFFLQYATEPRGVIGLAAVSSSRTRVHRMLFRPSAYRSITISELDEKDVGFKD